MFLVVAVVVAPTPFLLDQWGLTDECDLHSRGFYGYSTRSFPMAFIYPW